MHKRRQVWLGALLGTLIIASVTACNNDNKYTEPFKDAPRSGSDNMQPMNVVDNSDGFSNIGWKCVGQDGVYAAYHGNNPYAAIFVVPNDPNCSR